jgi:hypothetical protein
VPIAQLLAHWPNEQAKAEFFRAISSHPGSRRNDLPLGYKDGEYGAEHVPSGASLGASLCVRDR